MYIANSEDLKMAIEELEQRKMNQEKLLIAHFSQTYESLKPINMIRHTFHEIAGSPDLKSNLLDATMGIGVGILSKKLFIGGSGNFFKKIAGTLLELGIAGIVAKNSDKIKTVGKGVFNLFSSDRKAKG